MSERLGDPFFNEDDLDKAIRFYCFVQGSIFKYVLLYNQLMKLFDGEISDIFVGRKTDLGNLQKALDKIKARNEAEKVYTILNVPGIGKTKLIKHFGKTLQIDSLINLIFLQIPTKMQ